MAHLKLKRMSIISVHDPMFQKLFYLASFSMGKTLQANFDTKINGFFLLFFLILNIRIEDGAKGVPPFPQKQYFPSVNIVERV